MRHKTDNPINHKEYEESRQVNLIVTKIVSKISTSRLRFKN